MIENFGLGLDKSLPGSEGFLIFSLSPRYITVVKNGKFSTIILSDDKRVRYVTNACHWTSKTSRTSKKLKKANEGHKGQMKGQNI